VYEDDFEEDEGELKRNLHLDGYPLKPLVTWM
jgi:hypothetical protein